jgi:hypothetical protein
LYDVDDLRFVMKDRRGVHDGERGRLAGCHEPVGVSHDQLFVAGGQCETNRF